MPLAKTTRAVYKRRMKKRTIRSIPDIVEAFGGKAKLAAWLGVTHQAACNWYREGCIPTAYHYQLHLWFTSHGVKLDPETFGLQTNGRLIPRADRAKAA